jgi:hypothetical protein
VEEAPEARRQGAWHGEEESKALTPWDGILPAARRLLMGTAAAPKAKRIGEPSTPASSTYYEGMNQDYRWFRQDEIVRRCIVANAFFSTTAAGFETVLDSEGSPGDYSYVKERIDALNRRVNMDEALFVAQVKRSVYGRAGFEVVADADGYPGRLIPLQSERLRPTLDENWTLTGYRYGGRDAFYAPEEVLYFPNLSLEADVEGLSDVEPLRGVCQARHDLLRENFPEIARTLWAPYVVLKANTSGLPQEEAERVVESLAEVARAGKSIAMNESVEAEVVDLTPDIAGLCQLLDRLEQSVVACLGTPRFLLGRPVENRATAYAELEAYVGGTVAHVQRCLRRELERQWYDKWTARLLEEEGEQLPPGGPLPARVKHRWNPVRASDVYEMAKAVAVLWGGGGGALSGRFGKVWEMMGWDPSELEAGG